MKWEITGEGTFSMKDLKGKLTVLYFYPRDNTPGCTKEGQDFAAQYKGFKKLGAEIIGVSTDSIASHLKFKAKLKLPFELVSDPEGSLCEKFGVWKEKSMYGKKFMGIERSTFVIGSDGKILQEWRGVKVPEHVTAVLEFLKQ
jgi:thioredoxin-dependent peroxiredoxin